jgi:hypothetical protein
MTPVRKARIRRSFDGVVASYIREISAGDRSQPQSRSAVPTRTRATVSVSDRLTHSSAA